MKTILIITFAMTAVLATAAPRPPLDLGATNTYNAVTMPDSALESFHRRALGGHVRILRLRSTDNGRTWSRPDTLLNLSVEPWGGPMPLLDLDGELHFVISKARGDGRRPNVDRFIDLYHLRSTDGRTRWTEPQRIYEGYCGSLQGVFQLKNGRIIAPFADWLPGVRTAPPTGPSVTTCVYSDDGGKTWRRSSAKLTAPCHDGYNGGNYGACEPTILELKDGRVWMLIRTQDGFLYESFANDGVNWSEAKRSRFHSSNSPAFPVRLPDGRIAVFWNNCEMPPRAGKEGVYGGRDALHAAISDDEGKTWRGFREVYRDPTRNASPPKDGDRGTAYPHATATKDGKILLVSGQGANLRHRLLIDPDWLLETERAERFDNLDAWHVFKGFGPAQRFWRDRVQGPQLIPHPGKPGAKVLHIRRPDDRDADGAVWNFPAGQSGKLTLRLRAEKGFGGGRVSLTDRFFDPCNDAGEKQAAFVFPLGKNLQPGEWHTLDFAWNGNGCVVTLDGKSAGTLAPCAPTPDGLSYFRLRSTAAAVDAAGFLVESVSVAVNPPTTALWPDQAPVGDGTFEDANANLTVHLPAPDKANGAAVVICPGGGYQRHVVGAEGHEIARWLNGHGIAGIVLEYRMPQGRPFVPLLDAQRAIRHVRSRAADWRIAPDRIGIIGFSAGGHLASTAATHFDDGDPKSADPVARLSCRPDFTLLVYPVVTMGDKTHSGSKTNLLGSDPKPELVELFSNEKQITAKTPPAFLAHAIDDKAVPIDNSRDFAVAMRAHNVPVKYLELPNGGHGLNHYQGPSWDAWQKQAIEWLKELGFTSHRAVSKR